MIAGFRKSAELGLLPLALVGCATNALRVEVAGDVAAQAKTATTAARTYLDTIQNARQTFNSDLIGIDAQCAPDHAFVRQMPDYATFRAGNDPSGWLCMRDVSSATYPDAIDLAPIDHDLEPDFALINAIGAYGEAITKIVDDKSGDPSGDIAEAIALARSGDALIHTVAGGTPSLPGAEDPRAKAATDLVTLLGQLANEQNQVAQLRKLSSSAGSATLIAKLRDHIANWELGRRTDANMRLIIAKILFARTLAAAPGPSERQSALATYYARSKETFASHSLGGAIDAALEELAAADQHLRDVLAKNPKLTDKDRAEIAHITRQRLTAAFNALSALLLALKGG